MNLLQPTSWAVSAEGGMGHPVGSLTQLEIKPGAAMAINSDKVLGGWGTIQFHEPELMPSLGGCADGGMEEFRREISTVIPNNSMQVRVNCEEAKSIDVFQWLEDWPPKFICQIDFALDTVTKS